MLIAGDGGTVAADIAAVRSRAQRVNDDATLALDQMSAALKEFEVGGVPQGAGVDIRALTQVFTELQRALRIYAGRAVALSKDVAENMTAIEKALTDLEVAEADNEQDSQSALTARVAETVQGTTGDPSKTADPGAPSGSDKNAPSTSNTP